MSILVAGASLALGAQAASYALVLLGFGLSGLGVAAFHPEAARKAHVASGDRRTTGMSYFSVGGGLGFALAPVITAAVLLRLGHAGPAGLARSHRLDRHSGCWLTHRGEETGSVELLRPSDHLWRRRLDGVRHPERRDGLPVDRFLWTQHVPGALLHRSVEPRPRRGQPCACGVSRHQHLRHTYRGAGMADRFGRRQVIRAGFTGAVVFMTFLIFTSNRFVALALLVPLAIFHLHADERPGRAWAGIPAAPRGDGRRGDSGAGRERRRNVAPLLGWLGDRQGLTTVLVVLLALLAAATAQTFILPPAGRRDLSGSGAARSQVFGRSNTIGKSSRGVD